MSPSSEQRLSTHPPKPESLERGAGARMKDADGSEEGGGEGAPECEPLGDRPLMGRERRSTRPPLEPNSILLAAAQT